MPATQLCNPQSGAGLYDYPVPQGYGDTFYIYGFDAVAEGLVNGTTYNQLGIPVHNGDFMLRYIQGVDSVAPAIQVYDWLRRQLFQTQMNLGAFRQGFCVLPERHYPVDGNIRFDLPAVAMQQVGIDNIETPVRASQLLFSGVRRRRDWVSDPAPSMFGNYYEKPYAIGSPSGGPFLLSITNFASVGGVTQPGTTFQIPIKDYDFELRRIEISNVAVNQRATVSFSPFKIMLYDSNGVTLFNIPLLSDYVCHQSPAVAANLPLAFFPIPPVLYRVNSVIKFDIYSLITQNGANAATLPAQFALTFHGVRRYPCQ